MQIAMPFQIDARGRTAASAEDRHLRDLIESLLFTSPGERVNRPDFGSGLRDLLFAPNSPELATAVQFLVQGSLQQWLGDRITVENVEVEAIDAMLTVRVDYIVNRTQQRAAAEFTRQA
jgi:phage baseplate assembly protein W